MVSAVLRLVSPMKAAPDGDIATIRRIASMGGGSTGKVTLPEASGMYATVVSCHTVRLFTFTVRVALVAGAPPG